MNSILSGCAERGHHHIVYKSAAFWLLAALLLASHASSDVKSSARSKPPSGSVAAASLKPITAPIRLAYLYKSGDVRRYKVTAFFTGHFPPFATAGSPPIHLMTDLDYVATVKKVTDKGAEVEFNVEKAELSVLEEEPGPDGKVDPDKAALFPVPISQVQKMFNATATFKPNGSIANIQGGDSSSVKIDIGIDLRKLFLVTAPVIFADKPVKVGDEWPFEDGLLGSKPGKTTYTGRLQSIGSRGNNVSATVTQQADSAVDTKLDKEGNSTDNAGAAVGSLVGKVTLTGTIQLAGTTAAPAGIPSEADGRVTDGKMAMVVNLKRTLPDPDQPGKQQVTDIDIKARMFVKPLASTPKPTAKVKPVESNVNSSKPGSGHSDKSTKKT